MATTKELSFPVEDFMGVDRQVDQENISDYNQWTVQNLWEKKLNVLETRGGSADFATGWPSNATGLDNVCRIFKDTLDHKRIVAVQGSEDTPGTPQLSSIPTGVSLSWVTGSGSWFISISGNTNFDYTPHGLFLRFYGYGYDKFYYVSDVTTITGYTAATASTLKVSVSSALADSNITGIEVYGVVATGYGTNTSLLSPIWVGRIDLIANPTGNFSFADAPVSRTATSPTSEVLVGSLPAEYTIAGQNVSGATLIANKTYYVAVLPQYLYSGSEFSLNAYRQFGAGATQLGTDNILSITLAPGENSISVNYPTYDLTQPPTFNNMLIAIGEDPQLLQVIGITNINTNASGGGQQIFQIESFPQNNPGVVDIEWVSESACNLRFRQSDFSTNDTLTLIENDGTKIPVFITRQSGVNRTDEIPDPRAGEYISVAFTAGSGSSDGTVGPDSSEASGYPTNYDPIPANSRIQFNYSSGGSMPGGVTADTDYYWQTYGNTSGILTDANGSAVSITSTGSKVYMVLNASTTAYPQCAANPVDCFYVGGAYLPQPLIGQKFAFAQYHDLAYFVTGISNNTALSTNAGFLNSPISGTSYYVTDGTVAALVVNDFSSSPTPVPPATIIFVYQDSVVVGGGEICGDTVYFSRATNPANFEVVNNPGLNQFFQVDGKGEWVTGFGIFTYSLVYVIPTTFLFVTKKNSCFLLENLPVVNTDSAGAATTWPTTFLQRISKSVGTPQGRTIIHTPIGLIFAAVDNVYLCRGGGAPQPVGDPLMFILMQSDLSQASAVYHDQQYKLSFYNSNWPGTSGYNNVEFWLDVRKMNETQGKPDWKGPMIGRQIDYDEVENLTGDGTVYNLTRDRVCVDRENMRVYKTDIIPAETDTTVYDFTTAVESLIETKYYRVTPKDDNWNKLFTRTYWKVRTNCVSASPLSATEQTYVDGTLVDTQTLSFSGQASVNFDDQPQSVSVNFPTTRYRGRVIKKIFSTNQRIGIGGFELFYIVERRRLGN